MSNLFKTNLTQDQLDAQVALKRNIEFCRTLIRDLVSTFEVVVDHRRCSETVHETIVYPPRHDNRYGWGFTFEATDKGVTFQDGRGIWIGMMGRVLGVPITDHYEVRNAEYVALQVAGAKIGIEVIKTDDKSCGDHFRLKMTLSQDDPHLNAKIRAIIGTMQNQFVNTKLVEIGE